MIDIIEHHAIELILLSLIAGSAYCQYLAWVMDREQDRQEW